MQPLKPTTIQGILEARPDAKADIEEYERLLAKRFTVNPYLPKAPEALVAGTALEGRLKELHEKLFGAEPLRSDP